MSQTLAILLDAYRELNARKMFWISLGISALVVCVFAGLGINERGVEVLWFTIDTAYLNSSIIPRSLFYKTLFVSVGVSIWLGWASTILALVSTASIIPDFVSSGAIEGMLARPISRTRLFLTKYAGALLFVVLQALVFTLASVLAIGLRSGVWLWPLMLAVPLVTLFFSYLYCVSALVGVWTRSTLASLLAGLALWGAVLVVGVGETIALTFKISADGPIALLEKDIEVRRTQIAAEKSKGEPAERIGALESELQRREGDLAQKRSTAESAARWHRIIYTAKTIFPKTGETKDLLERVIINDKEIEAMLKMGETNSQRGGGSAFGPPDTKTARQIDKVQKSRSVWWVLGTSLLFEAAIIALACRIFAKRDF